MRKENCKGEEHNELPKDPLGGRSSLSSPHQSSPTQLHCAKTPNTSSHSHGRLSGKCVRHLVQQHLPQQVVQKTGLSVQAPSSPNIDTVTNLMNALPGNSSVNTVQHATVDEAVLSTSSAPRPVLVTDQWTRSLTRDTCFLCGLRHAKIERLCFLCVVRAERIYASTGMGIGWTWVPKFQVN
jgi:hypothetical protein